MTRRSNGRAVSPIPMGEGKEAEIEVRLLYELDDFAPSEGLERFREMERDKQR